MPWVTALNATELDSVQTALQHPQRSGVMLAGPDGVGKTLLARITAEGFAREHPGSVLRWVRGTAPGRNVPFGAFRRLIDVAAEPGRPAALLRAARDTLTRHHEDLLLVVDDAHDLDNLSATMVYQLALAKSARLVVTLKSGPPVPDAIAALASDELLIRIDPQPLDRARTATVLESALGAPLRPGALEQVFARSQGNPLYLRHLVHDGGMLRADDGWRCRDEPPLALADLIDAYLSALPAPARTVLNYLAVAEPLTRTDLAALTGERAVERAEAAGAVIADGADQIYAAHPLYVHRAGAALGAHARALRTSVLAQLATHPVNHASDRLRLAALAADSDTPGTVADLAAAANLALGLGELTLAERLARTGLERSGGLAARLPLAHALAWQGRGREAGALLAAVNPDQLSETELLAWALPRAANQFWMLSEPERATAFLQATRSRVTAPTARLTLDALAATFAMNAGAPLRALQLAREVLAAPQADETAIGWAASTAALCSARIGRLDDVESLAARALTVAHPGLLRFTSGFGRVTALVMAGRLQEARALAQRYTDFAELQQPGRAIGEVLVGYVAIAQGDLEAAVALLGRAADALTPTGYSWGPLSLMLLAQALGQRGDQFEAAKVVHRAESRHGLKSALFAPELALARAWSMAARGDATGAIGAAREAVQAAERAGQTAIALRALQDAARLGDIRAVYRAERLSFEVDCALGRLTVAHARALAAGDARALAQVADDLAAAGMHPAAADAAAQAQRTQPVG
ncbi:MAG: AAA family ATPase [Mycobacterium sp.]|uniref:AAA family ATPase n=1 Tax=Mycobacterium sp. TaxID=1785 RepID=UPI0026189319|nr:AAA family ATPase [Mycobacterium sp.]MDI3314138.1 AAA family ATPase [Mycobacterium sp.]